MSRGVRWSVFAFLIAAALIALAGCSHYWIGEREPWRRDAEVACLNSGAARETPERVRISAINGPGICGMDFPLRVAKLGAGAPLGYSDEPLRPPGAIPNAATPPRWPIAPPGATPSPPLTAAPLPPPGSLSAVPSRPRAAGQPLSLTPPGLPERETDEDFAPDAPRPYDGAPPSSRLSPLRAYPPPAAPAPPGVERQVPLGPPRAPLVTGAAGPVVVKPPAALACPIVSALDQWINAAVQPAAMRWFGEPVVEIKQISAYSCRGMNGNPNAQISEHAFGNALDIAEFLLADGRRVSVQYGWHGMPQEQGFLRDVQAAACAQFSTVLAPGANIYHYNHIHVDLMRHAGGRHICEPAAIPGELVAERARARYAAQHDGDPGVTGTIASKRQRRSLGYSGEADDRRPLAFPGED
jgi:extensin-like protein